MKPRAPAVLGMVLVVLVALLAACRSPNRGRWAGSFDGDVSGVVEFTINTRGTRARGRITGQTNTGEPFVAALRGTLRQDFLAARFEGSASFSGALPLGFTGELTGSLAAQQGKGDWQATLKVTEIRLAGTFAVEQQPP